MPIEVGKCYGYRKQRYAVGKPLRCVLVTKVGPPKSLKYRTRWLSGEYEGLEEWVRRDTLLCPWEEAPAYIEDEIRLAQAVAVSEKAYRTPEWHAVYAVFSELEEPFELAEWVRYEGLMVIKHFPATIADYGLTPEELLVAPFAFVNREGIYLAPFATALEVTKRLCNYQPERIITGLRQQLQADRQAATTGWYVSPSGGRGRLSAA